MPSEDAKKLRFNKYQKSDKAPFTIYAYLECWLEKTARCKNDPENSSTTKVNEHIPSDFLMSTISSFKSIGNKHKVYREKDCLKKFCESFREDSMKTINFNKKKMTLLTKEQQESNENAKTCYICIERI